MEPARVYEQYTIDQVQPRHAQLAVPVASVYVSEPDCTDLICQRAPGFPRQVGREEPSLGCDPEVARVLDETRVGEKQPAGTRVEGRFLVGGVVR